MDHYGFHRALEILNSVQESILSNNLMSRQEREYRWVKLEELKVTLQENYDEYLHLDANVACKSADELEHEENQLNSRLEAAFGPSDWEDDKWN